MADSFKDLNVSEELNIATLEAGYSRPTEIQAKVIPAALKGRDIVGAAPTGTGKSAAYLLPIIQNILADRRGVGANRISGLVIVPTKELAIQTQNFILEFSSHLNIRSTVAVGGMGISPQMQEIRRGTDIVIATPGRALELIERKVMILDDLSFFVLDEVDRMLHMGFIHDISTIAQEIGQNCQFMVFSATITPETAKLAGRLLDNPLTIDIQQKKATLQTVDSVKCHTLFVDSGKKRKLLQWLLKEIQYTRVLIFVNSKADAERLGRDLTKIELPHAVIHGNKNNSNRQLAVDRFKRGKVKIMVATDIAARGFDVPELSMVVNYDLPGSPEVFVHRIGRTGRAGKTGEAYSFCDQSSRHIQERIDRSLEVEPEIFPWQPFHSDKVMEMPPQDSEEIESRQRKKMDREEPKQSEEKTTKRAQPAKKKKLTIQTKTGSKTVGKRPKITGKGRQKANRPSNKLQKKRGFRH